MIDHLGHLVLTTADDAAGLDVYRRVLDVSVEISGPA